MAKDIPAPSQQPVESVEEIINKIREKSETAKLVVKNTEVLELTAGELTELANKNPSHPDAVEFLKATAGLPKNLKVFIDKANLEAVLQNKRVETKTTLERTGDGKSVQVETKSVV